MSNWIFELALAGLAFAAFGYVFFTLVFSKKNALRHEQQLQAQNQRPRFDRREAERRPPAADTIDGQRRGGDRRKD